MANRNMWHPWQEYADLIDPELGLESVSSDGFSVRLMDGTRTVEFGEWLAKEHYDYFAPMLDDLDKTAVAKAVVENLLSPGLFPEFSAGWWALRQRYGQDEEQWLPDMVATRGFDTVTEEMRQAIAEYKATPRP